MNSSRRKRIAIVSRRFWPISGPTESHVADLADQFGETGSEVKLFTAAWQKNWPIESTFREFSIQRLSRPASGPWGTYRYQRALTRALDEFRPDAVLMFGDGEDLGPVRKMLGSDVTLVLRIDHRAVSMMSRSAQRNACLSHADSIFCDSQRTRNEIVSRKIALPSDVQLIVDGVVYPENHRRSLIEQANSRALLGDAHPVLRIEPAQPLVVTGAPMNGDGGVCDLVRAWQIVLESWPKAKLWIIGDGSRSRKVWDTISDLDMIYSAIMTGYFDDMSDIFQAADLYVHPIRNAVNCQCLFSAIAHQVCPLVVDTSLEPISVRDVDGYPNGEFIEVEKNRTGIVAPAGNPMALGEAISMALKSTEARNQLGVAAARAYRPATDIRFIGNVLLRALSGDRKPQDATGATSR